MSTLGELIRARRKEIGLTLQALADGAGCAKGYLSLIENEKRGGAPSEDLLRRLERSLRLPSGRLVSVASLRALPPEMRRDLRELERERTATRRLVEALKARGLDALHRSGDLKQLVAEIAPQAEVELLALPTQVPVINRVAAGYPREFTDLGYPARVAEEYVSVPDLADADAFAARVVGDSMAPQYLAGDVVVFSPERAVADGSDCFVRFEKDAETTFKRVYFEGAGREMVRLQPLNPVYPSRTVHREEVSGMYAAVSVIRKVGAGL